MPAMYVSEEIVVNKPVAEVFGYVRDFKQWPEWSPWLICEPETKLVFGQDEYSWDGEVVGAGRMAVKEARENEEITYHLEFLKPWKSQADVCMIFTEVGEGTKVTWNMNSKLPWFLFFLKAMMECMVGMDYQRGLRMLKERMETGDVLSKLDIVDRVSVPECQYVGIERTCTMDEMPKVMEADFGKLAPLYEEQGDHEEPMFTIYSQWKLSKGMVTYVACAPVKDVPGNLPSGMISDERPSCDAFAVIHTGAYQHLGNAWSAAMMRARVKLFKQSKAVFPFEQYITNPGETSEADTVTRICLPRKD